jgi:membrane protease YdiL (CAAX protease family)
MTKADPVATLVSESAACSEQMVGYSADTLLDRRQRIAGLLIVLVVAFLSSILASVYGGHQQWVSSYSDAQFRYGYLNRLLMQLTSLALLFYVIRQNRQKRSDLGLSFRAEEIIYGMLLWGFSMICYRLASPALLSFSELLGWQRAAPFVPQLRVGLGFVIYCFLIVNPVFEEMIVRAFFMSEIIALTESSTLAVFFSTLVQTSYHIYQGLPYALSAGVIFLIFSVYYARTRRIVPIIVAHFITDLVAHYSYALHLGATHR